MGQAFLHWTLKPTGSLPFLKVSFSKWPQEDSTTTLHLKREPVGSVPRRPFQHTGVYFPTSQNGWTSSYLTKLGSHCWWMQICRAIHRMHMIDTKCQKEQSAQYRYQVSESKKPNPYISLWIHVLITSENYRICTSPPGVRLALHCIFFSQTHYQIN